MAGDPIEGQILLLTAAKASVQPDELLELVERADATLRDDLERYRREYERVYDGEEKEAFLVGWGHWEDLGETLDLSDAETSALRRAHEEQLLRIGRRTDREDEFESALEIREAVFVGTDRRGESDAGSSVPDDSAS